MAETSATRRATISRKTNETQVSVSVNIDGSGANTISTGVGWMSSEWALKVAGRGIRNSGGGKAVPSELSNCAKACSNGMPLPAPPSPSA